MPNGIEQILLLMHLGGSGLGVRPRTQDSGPERVRQGQCPGGLRKDGVEASGPRIAARKKVQKKEHPKPADQPVLASARKVQSKPVRI